MTQVAETTQLVRVDAVSSATPSREALKLMELHGLPYLPVVGPEGNCLGVVLRRALEFGCTRMRHGADCPVQVHIKEDVEQVVGEPGEAIAPEGSAPVVVLDVVGRPLGILVSG